MPQDFAIPGWGMGSPLSAESYFSQEIHDREREKLFGGYGCLGHESLAPSQGDFHVLDWIGGGSKMLVRSEGGVEMLSNVCRHRQALMLEGRGSAKNIVCPLHRWTYDLEGKLLGAPRFPQNPCLHLDAMRLYSWRGFLFDPRSQPKYDLEGLDPKTEIDASGYVYAKTVVSRYDFNWKTFIEVYLEDYHVEPYHPGLGHFVDCSDLRWEFAPGGSLQVVGVNHGLKRHGSEAYRRYAEALLEYRKGELPSRGAIWMARYPDTMIEWYPEALIVSRVVPAGVGSCENIVEFYYPEEVARFEPELMAAQQEAYMETVREDDRICYAMQKGRRALFEEGSGQAEEGPYQHPMETGMAHFHQWYRERMADRDGSE